MTEQDRELRRLRLRALADPQRAGILERLARADASVGDLVQELGLAQSTVSHHLAQLRKAGLAGLRRAGRHHDYFLIAGALDDLLNWMQELRELRMRQGWAAEGYREEVIRGFLEDRRGVLPDHPRKREVVLDWLCAMLDEGRFYAVDELGALWSTHVEDWRELLEELEQRRMISGNGELYIVSR